MNEIDHRKSPHIAFHGSFSLMVNYDAILRYFENKGGQGYRASARLGLKTLAFNMGFDHHELPTFKTRLKKTISKNSLPAIIIQFYRSHIESIDELKFQGALALLRVFTMGPLCLQ